MCILNTVSFTNWIDKISLSTKSMVQRMNTCMETFLKSCLRLMKERMVSMKKTWNQLECKFHAVQLYERSFEFGRNVNYILNLRRQWTFSNHTSWSCIWKLHRFSSSQWGMLWDSAIYTEFCSRKNIPLLLMQPISERKRMYLLNRLLKITRTGSISEHIIQTRKRDLELDGCVIFIQWASV